jgi:hypothetical protein
MPVSVAIKGWAREFLARPRRYGTLATGDASGAPLQAVVWYALRDDGILVNSRVGRRWPTHLLRDPGVSFLVHDREDYVSVRGQAQRLYEGERALEDILALARSYRDPADLEASLAEFRTHERISFLIVPDAVFIHR